MSGKKESMKSIDVIELAMKILEKYPLCDHCLGRQFARLGLDLGNDERGKAIKTILAMRLHHELKKEVINKDVLKRFALHGGDPITRLYSKIYEEEIKPYQCYVCGGKLSKRYFEEIAEKIVSLLNEYNAYTFLVGVSLPQEVMLRELEVASMHGLETSESIKNEIKREIGKIVRDKYGFTPDFTYPDIVVIVDYETNELRPVVNPILLEGRYWKRGRNISHTIWISSRGVKEYPYSLEEFFNDNLKDLFDAERVVLHASGREDVDARMLGTGRPMVIEIKNPRFRYVDLDLVNYVLKSPLIEAEITSYSSRSRIEYLKGEGSKKMKAYKVLVYCEKQISDDELHRLEEFFKNKAIKQRTPTRILRRKKDYLRIRKVYEVKILKISNHVFEAVIYCDGGLYVKELVHGDNGRTTPSFAEFLEAYTYPLELDVFVVETK